MLKVLFVGDVCARPGREKISERLASLKKEKQVDFCIVNGENASHGKGLSLACADELYEAGADFITMGNHTWSNAGIFDYIDDYAIVRPANFSKDLPGRGYDVAEAKGVKIGILDLQGRVYMDDSTDNPFECAKKCVEEIRKETNVIIVDFHAEATSEKIALAYYLDGTVSAVIGTHTHVQTADERILEKGTAFITDAGMTGPVESIIGMKKNAVVDKFINNIPRKFEPAEGKAMLNGVLLEIDEITGKALKIERVFEK